MSLTFILFSNNIHTKPDQRKLYTVFLVIVVKKIYYSKRFGMRNKQREIEQNRYIVLSKIIIYTVELHNK